MTENDRYKITQHLIRCTIDEMSEPDMIDFITDRLENEFDGWSNVGLIEHFQICWPEHFKNFEFEKDN